MIHELKYNGYSASPGDHEAPEGDLAVALNLIPEDNTIKPVLPPCDVAEIPPDPNNHADKGRKILCIHQTSAFKHYIIGIDFAGLSPNHPPYTNLYYWDGNDGSEPVRIGVKSFSEIYKVEPIGNTLVVLADDGIHYILWKQNSYHYLGTHLPELDLQFRLDNPQHIESDKHKASMSFNPSNNEFTFEKFYDWINNSDNKEYLDSLRQAIMASVNQAVAKAGEKHLFSFPFFVRYAFRLYDGSLTMHSAPCLMIPTMNLPEVDIPRGSSDDWETDLDGGELYFTSVKIMASLYSYTIFCKGLDDMQTSELTMWSDIISSVDIFISPQFYTYNQGAKDSEITIGPNENDNKAPANSQINRQIVENGNFYLVKQIRVSQNYSDLQPALKQTGAYIGPDFELSNDNIVVRELMTDDYGTHDELMAERSHAYNGRINLSVVSKRLFNGFNPACMWNRVENSLFSSTTHDNTTATVVIETEGREIIVKSVAATIRTDSSNTVVWFYYPNPSAKRAYMDMGGNMVVLELTAHPMLNGAYFYGLSQDAVQNPVTSIPATSSEEERIIEQPNKVYTSEVNNPFYFPATGINIVGTGEIIGICSAVKALSQGQFGQFPLYAFTTEGVWALQTTSEGGYSAVQPVTRDVCRNADSITQLDDAVLFSTDRGIMLISGSTVQCISEAIDGDDPRKITDIHPSITQLGSMQSLDIDVLPFRSFLPDCRMIYDYEGQRIIVYNPAYYYAYIYSLESHKWGMMESNIEYAINAYPDAMAVTRDGHLVNFSEPVEDTNPRQLLITRPFTLGQADILKTIDTMLQRGMFPKRQDKVQTVLYGSRDLYNWHLVASSKDENLRGSRGSGYKWFRVALLMHLTKGESVTSASIQFTDKLTNRLR